MLKVADFFSGIGGFSLGLERAGMETVAFCESDEKCRQVLKKHWPAVKQYDDIRRLTADRLREDGILADSICSDGGGRPVIRRAQNKGRKTSRTKPASVQPEYGQACPDDIKQVCQNELESRHPAAKTIDLICGGFPCQPFSQAGKRQGEKDDRHLWPEMFRLIQEVRPRWVLGENVAGIINMGLDQVLSDLESADYTAEAIIIPACAVDAPHRRDRVWIVAHTAPLHRETKFGNQQNGILPQDVSNPSCELFNGAGGTGPLRWPEFANSCEDVADSESIGVEGDRTAGEQESGSQVEAKLSGCQSPRSGANHWPVEPDVGRVAHGVPGRVDRLKQLGNAVVPQVVEVLGRAIMEIDNKP